MKALVAAVCIVSAVGCTGDRIDEDDLEFGRKDVEPEIARAIADETNLASRISAWIVTEPVDLTGEWVKNAHDDGIALKLKMRRGGGYDVVFYAAGDLAHYALERKGSFVSGVLNLDRPVLGYCQHTPFKYFYLVRSPLGTRLAAQPEVRRWMIEEGCMDWPDRQWARVKAFDMFDKSMFLRRMEAD